MPTLKKILSAYVQALSIQVHILVSLNIECDKFIIPIFYTFLFSKLFYTLPMNCFFFLRSFYNKTSLLQCVYLVKNTKLFLSAIVTIANFTIAIDINLNIITFVQSRVEFRFYFFVYFHGRSWIFYFFLPNKCDSLNA